MTLKERGSGAASAKDGSKTASKLDRLRKLSGHSEITWEAATPALLAGCVAAVSSQGALVSFSKTSDGGALCVYVKDGTQAERLYAASAEEADAHLEELTKLYTE